jgi:C-terminal processing protease CtpA/Prc
LSEQFELWFYLFESQADSFRVDVRRQSGDTASRWIAAVPPSALRENVPDQHPPLALTFLEDSTTALLRIGTFAADEISGAGLSYPRFLDTVFSRIRDPRITDLILDLRGNDGGRDTYGARLLSHLSSRPFAYYRSLETRVDRVSFWRHTNVDSTFNIRFGTGLISATNGTYQLPRSRHQNLGLQQPRAPVFTGRVWALIDGGTFSTAAEFCAVAQSLGRATFIGQETGGTYAGNTSGTFVILTLPRTGVRVVVPLVRYNLAVRAPRNPGRGVIPDHAIGSLDVEGSDAFVALALQLIRRARGQ